VQGYGSRPMLNGLPEIQSRASLKLTCLLPYSRRADNFRCENERFGRLFLKDHPKPANEVITGSVMIVGLNPIQRDEMGAFAPHEAQTGLRGTPLFFPSQLHLRSVLPAPATVKRTASDRTRVESRPQCHGNRAGPGRPIRLRQQLPERATLRAQTARHANTRSPRSDPPPRPAR